MKPRSIHVYQDDPIWDQHARWFQVADADLSRLFVATFQVHPDSDDWIGDADMERHARELRERFPAAVLIY